VRIEQLEYVAAVTRCGSLRRASEHLHLSQPALSEAVTKLERELGVTLLDRRRSGARISRQGRDLLPHLTAVLEAVDRLRAAAGAEVTTGRTVRLGTVNAATTTLLLPAIEELRARVPGASVEIRNLQQAEIHTALDEGTLDVGLVNLLEGDDRPTRLEVTPLLRGRPVVVLPTGHPLADTATVTVDQLRAYPFIGMRAGYLMHRVAHRLFGSALPRETHTCDGAEVGKLMVAEGLGLTLLPDYSVVADPLARAGMITHRPVAGDLTGIVLCAVHRDRTRPGHVVRELLATLQETALAGVGVA